MSGMFPGLVSRTLQKESVMSISIDRRSLLVASAAAGVGATLVSASRFAVAQDATPTPPPVPDGPFTLLTSPIPTKRWSRTSTR